jgi:vancomycin permeability regulator SanA
MIPGMGRIHSFLRTRWGTGAVLTLLVLIGACSAVAWNGLQDDRHATDVMVVLGNKVRPDGKPSQALTARLDQAVLLYHEGDCRFILVSGGHGREGYDEPKVMRHYLEEAGVPSNIIFEDNDGTNTWHTAENTAAFLKARQLHSVLIVSQYFHLPRCRLAFARFGIKPVYTSPARYVSVKDFYSLPREIVGLIGYALRPAPAKDGIPTKSGL